MPVRGPQAPQEELLVELPNPIPPVTHFRGVAIVVSLGEVEARGLASRYWPLVPTKFHQTLREVSALSWIDVDVAMAHYRAIDALGLLDEDCISIGRAAADRAQSVLLTTVVRGLRASGSLNPATIFRRMDVFWGRMVRGGGTRAVQTGPKDLCCEVHGEFAQLRYIRLAWIGYFENALAPTARHVRVRSLPQPNLQAAAYAISWV